MSFGILSKKIYVFFFFLVTVMVESYDSQILRFEGSNRKFFNGRIEYRIESSILQAPIGILKSSEAGIEYQIES